MDRRARSKMPANRQPLGDVAKRVNAAVSSAAVSNADRYSRGVDGDENTSSQYKKSAPRGRPNPADASLSEHHRSSAHTATSTVDPRPSAAILDERDAADFRRTSQTSHASKASGTPRQPKRFIGPWELGHTLGKGTSARVRLARHRVSHEMAAIKIVSKATAHMSQAGSLANLDKLEIRNSVNKNEKGLRRMPLAIEREIAILKLIQHPNIIQLHDIWENRSEM